MTLFRLTPHGVLVLLLVILACVGFSVEVSAADPAGWIQQQGGDAEQKIGQTFTTWINIGSGIALGFLGIGVLWGFGELNGVVGNTEKAKNHIVMGLIGMAGVAGIWALLRVAAGLFT